MSREELLERSEELDVLGSAIEAAGAGRGSTWVIEGPAGIGKTVLLEACRQLAEPSQVDVLLARAGELEVDLPWNLVRQLFSEVATSEERKRAQLLSGAASLAAPALGLEHGGDVGALHGLYWLTVALAQQRPLLMAIDDLQWGDQASLSYLAYLSARASDLPIALVTTVRSDEPAAEALAALLASHDTGLLRLGPLSPAGSATFVRRGLGSDAAEEFCNACHTATGGNPFLLGELISELGRDQIEPVAERAVAVASIRPETVARALLLRISRLPQEARELANAIAILGDRSRLADAAELAGLEPAGAAAAADTLVEAGILADGLSLRFAHPLAREVVYDAIPLHRRTHRHGEAARLLASAGAGADRIAAQLLPSEPAGDPWAVERLREAAALARADGAPASAADLLTRALREPPADAERFGVLVDLGGAELTAGRTAAAEHLLEAVAVCSEPLVRAHTLLALGRALFLAGELQRAADTLDRGLQEAGDEDPSLTALLRAAWLTVARTQLPLRAPATALLHEIAARPPDPVGYGERALLAQVAGQLVFDGEARPRSLELAHAAVGDGELIALETSDGTAWLAAAGALGWGDDFDGFDALHAQALDDARRRGSVIGFASASYGLSFTRYYRGMLSAAIADAEQAIAAEREGWRHFLPAARAQLAWALIDRGQLDAARASLERARSDPGWEQSTMQALVYEAEARIHLVRGEPERALSSALAAGEVAAQALVPNPSLCPWRSRAGIAAARLKRHQQAAELLEEELTLAQRFGAPRPIGVALMHSGLARGADGIEALEGAVEVLAGSPARLEHARALVHLGAAQRRNRNLTVARESLQAGLDASADCQADALERYARDELAAAGARPRRRQLRARDELTPSEQRVAELAASGMGNREIAQALFVSLRTVETHLTHTYQKLSIESREELARGLAAAAQR